MTETLLLRPSTIAEDRFDTAVLGADGQLLSHSLAAQREEIDSLAQGRKVVGLIPGSDVLLTSLRLPPM